MKTSDSQTPRTKRDPRKRSSRPSLASLYHIILPAPSSSPKPPLLLTYRRHLIKRRDHRNFIKVPLPPPPIQIRHIRNSSIVIIIRTANTNANTNLIIRKVLKRHPSQSRRPPRRYNRRNPSSKVLLRSTSPLRHRNSHRNPKLRLRITRSMGRRHAAHGA